MAVTHSFVTPKDEQLTDETFDDMLKSAVENSREIDLDDEQSPEETPAITEDSYYAEILESPSKKPTSDDIMSPSKSKKRGKRKRSPRKKRTLQE